ncbi:MAG: indolepyruvate oxidoreductase subunit beta family protein [Rhodoblastus sp.]
MSETKIRTILIGALGGEGGGVLMDWIVHCARMSGLAVQATSVPGVAQRTGSTSYYIEMAEKIPGAPDPVFALIPMPGRVDFIGASELVEAARLMERGLVSPRRTVLVSSTSRFYTTAEKMETGDGRFESARVIAAGQTLAKSFVALDLERIARETGTMASATLFGALAGVGAFPWERATCESAIGAGRAAGASRAGFNAAFDEAARKLAVPRPLSPPLSRAEGEFAEASGNARPSPRLSPQGGRATGEAAGVFDNLPSEARELALLGHARCADYQDRAYAGLFAQRVQALAKAAPASPERDHALAEAARRLALWMTYEDIARVADLKTRPERFARIRAEAGMRSDQILSVTEYLKPGAEELAAALPARIGAWFMQRVARKGAPGLIGRPQHVTTTSLRGFFLMRLLAQFRRIRRSSLRFGQEQDAIERWLAAMSSALAASPAYAAALAELPRLLKGYGETQLRGHRSYEAIFAGYVAPAVAAREFANPAALRKTIAAALADPGHAALDAALKTAAAKAAAE